MIDLKKKEFIEYLAQNEESGQAFKDQAINQPYDISPNEFSELDSLTITFDTFDKFYILRHLLTNEIFLGDMNIGGHAARSRIIKVNRDDFFSQPEKLKKWYNNYSFKIWEK